MVPETQAKTDCVPIHRDLVILDGSTIAPPATKDLILGAFSALVALLAITPTAEEYISASHS